MRLTNLSGMPLHRAVRSTKSKVSFKLRTSATGKERCVRMCVALFKELGNGENLFDATLTWRNPACHSQILLLRTGSRQRSFIKARRLKTYFTVFPVLESGYNHGLTP